MDGDMQQDDVDAEGDCPGRRVNTCETRPGRVVFTEEDNNDGWIATDLTVDVER